MTESPELVTFPFQWMFGAVLTVIAAIVGYIFNWNTRIEEKIEKEREVLSKAVNDQRMEFKSDLERALDKQTIQIIQLMDARLDQVQYRKSRGEDNK